MQRVERRADQVPLDQRNRRVGNARAQGDGADCMGTVCYTVRDAHAYATAAHKCFFYTGITPSGNIRLDTAHLPAGTRMSIYLINSFGECIVADYTV